MACGGSQQLECARELLPAFIRWSPAPTRAPARAGGEPPWPGSATRTSVVRAGSVSRTRDASPTAGPRGSCSFFACSSRPFIVAVTGGSSERCNAPHHAVGHPDLHRVVVGDARGGCSVVLRGSSDCSPPQVLLVAELDAETEASALFELINERIALGTKLFDVRASTTPVSRAAARYQKGR